MGVKVLMSRMQPTCLNVINYEYAQKHAKTSNVRESAWFANGYYGDTMVDGSALYDYV